MLGYGLRRQQNRYMSQARASKMLMIHLQRWRFPNGGDITDKKVRKYIKSYSSLQNVEKSQSSNSNVWSILGQTDNYVDNNDVI